MSFRTAISNLASLNVPGVANNYDIDALPEPLGRAHLPALLVMPLDTQGNNLLGENGAGFQALAFSNGTRSVTYALTHLLLTAPAATRSGLRGQLPPLVGLIDAYFMALAADVRLGTALLEPAQVKVVPGVFTFGGVAYIGCAFQHTWLIEVQIV